MKTVTAVIVLFGVLLPFGNPGWAGTGSASATRFQHKQPTEAERLAMQQARDQAQQHAQAPSTQSAAGAPGPVGTPGPSSGQNAKSSAVHR
jgi:hypothetical protein